MTAIVEFSPYQRRYRSPSNAIRSAKLERAGALIRVRSNADECIFGYADLQLWPEIGTTSLEGALEELRKISNAAPLEEFLTEEVFATVGLAWRDRNRRQRTDQLLPNPTEHHRLFTSVESILPADLLDARRAGYRRMKIKVGRNPEHELAAFYRLATFWGEQAMGSLVSLRLDMNSAFTPDSAVDFLRRLPARISAALDFVEDPCPWDPDQWAKVSSNANVDLAYDRPSEGCSIRSILARNEIGEWISAGAISAVILKSSWTTPKVAEAAYKLFGPQQVIWTSTLGHPWGQLLAAREAAESASKHATQEVRTIHGAQSQVAYEEDEWSRSLPIRGPYFLTSSAEQEQKWSQWLTERPWHPLTALSDRQLDSLDAG